MNDYFAAELRSLREAAEDFAQAYPEQARQLKLTAGQDQDPYVERLLEGTAFLTAQIRQHIEDDLPDICETLLQQLCPTLLRPLPALTILQLSSRPGQLQQTYTLAKDTEVKSQPLFIEGGHHTLPFRTVYAAKINPLKVTQQTLESTQHGSVLKFVLQGDANINIKKLDLSDLKFFIQADHQPAFSLRLAMLTSVDKILITDAAQQSKNIGGSELIADSHFNADENLTPNPTQNYAGFQLIQEYFAFPEKHLFFVIKDLEKTCWQGTHLAFEIYFREDWTKQVRSEQVRLQLNCVPGINLIKATSEPIRERLRKTEYLIKPAEYATIASVYSIDSVTGISDNSGKTIHYVAMTSQQRQDLSQAYYHTYTRKTVTKKANLVLATGGEAAWEKQTISCGITICHQQYPKMFLAENTLGFIAQEVPSYLQITNLSHPTALLSAPQRENYYWELISFLSLNYQGLMKIKVWQQLLYLFNWTKAAENQRKIAGLETVTVRISPKIERGVIYQNLNFEATIHENHFISLGDLHLFGAILHYFLQSYVPLNLLLTTKIICQPSGREFIWHCQSGASFLI